ncbi:hypothetical protein [Oryza sativa Japonica Group]|uniref:Uncharacterized protein n=1 Tax=Oryza sativa subsp. japonica TaxID=39947 RepID=Q8S1C2_ORYSJ|nr:hypothetical protein [Oryza sativa Japonica Group]
MIRRVLSPRAVAELCPVACARVRYVQSTVFVFVRGRGRAGSKRTMPWMADLMEFCIMHARARTTGVLDFGGVGNGRDTRCTWAANPSWSVCDLTVVDRLRFVRQQRRDACVLCPWFVSAAPIHKRDGKCWGLGCRGDWTS